MPQPRFANANVTVAMVVTTTAAGGGSRDRVRDPDRTFSGRTPWSRNLQAPLRTFLETESGSAGVLLLATVAALAWPNLTPRAYDSAWETPLTIRLGDVGFTLTLREWVNSGLMTFFLFRGRAGGTP